MTVDSFGLECVKVDSDEGRLTAYIPTEEGRTRLVMSIKGTELKFRLPQDELKEFCESILEILNSDDGEE